jgi:hypothetical protein
VGLSCKKAFLFAGALTMACYESTAPPPFAANVYLLESIDGRPLPASIVAEPGDTISIIWSTLSLTGAGNAVLVERLRIVHPNTPPTQLTQTNTYVYHVTGHSILGDDLTFDYSPPCPINALCAAPPSGKLLGTTLVLSYGDLPGARPPSFYRRAGLD